MQHIQINLPEAHAGGQLQSEQQARRFNIWCCGRRWGKDVLLERRMVRKALKGGKPCAWYAPSYRMLTENWRMLRDVFAPVTLRASDTEHRIELVTGNVVEAWSLDNPDSSRGRKYGHIAINEAAMVGRLIDAWNMVIRPTLADYRGSADFGTTPKGLNDFYRIWMAANDNPDWTRHHYRTDDNPHIPPDEVAEMRRTLPERVVRQELDAEFVEDGGYFQGVDLAAVIDQPDTPEQHQGHYLVMGCDFALSEDYTVLTVGCRDCAKVVDWQRFNQLDYTYQRERIYSMADKWAIRGILPERNSIGEPNIELIRDRVLVLNGADGKPGFLTTATTKPGLIQGLAVAIEQRKLLIPRDFADELKTYEVETMASGHPKFSAPPGYHDDRVISLALTWQAMTSAAVQLWI